MPAEVHRLINDALASMDHVEVLFQIAREDQATFGWLEEHAHIAPTQLRAVLRDLEQAGLIRLDESLYRVTTNARDRSAVDAFVTAYNTRPVTLIRAVYARPSAIRSFADAFRLRREDDR